jgi:hypothetical protein
MKESMRQRLQTLARALTKKNKIKVMPGQPSTDFSTIYLNDSAEIIPGLPCTRAEAWVVTKASCAHESAHILFTCKKTWEDYLKWAKEHYPLPNLAKAVLNCLEDGRAERAMALRYPQTELLFAFSNNYFFKHGVGREGDLPQFLDGLISLATVGDIPKRINNPTVIMLLNQCLPFIEKGVKGLHTKDAAYTSHKILEILEPHIKDAVSDIEDQSVSTGTYSPEKAPSSDSDTRHRQPKRLKARVAEIDKREKSKPSSSSSEELEGSPTTPTAESEADETEDYADIVDDDDSTPPEDIAADKEPEVESEEESEKSPESQGAEDTGKGLSADGDSDTPYSFDDDTLAEEDSLEGLAELMEEAAKELDMLDRQEKRRVEEAKKEKGISPIELCSSIEWSDLHTGIEFDIIQPPESLVNPNELIKQVKPLAKKLATEIKPYFLPKNNYPQRGRRRGRIDARALYKTSFNEDRVFYKKAEPSQQLDVAAYLLIDGSGSMISDNKYLKAREAAMLCHLTLKELQIVHAATLFDAEFFNEEHRGRMVRHEALIEFSTSLTTNGTKLMAIRPKCDNRDGYSIRIAAKELALRPEKKKILLVLSDGKPEHSFDGYVGLTGQMDTRKAVIEAERNNIIIIGIHFGLSPSETHKKMYPNLVYSKIEYLPSVLGATLKRVLTKIK